MSSHAARIAFIHSIKATGRVTEPALRELVTTLARNGHAHDTMRIMNRYSSPQLMDSVLAGIADSKSGGIPIRLLSQLNSDLHLSDVKSLMTIFAVKGIHPQHTFRPKLVHIIKKVVSEDSECALLAISCLRRIKDERKFLWKLYTDRNGLDNPELTRHMAQIAGINGWGEDRVRIIMSRRSSPLCDVSVAMLIKSLCHYPGIGSMELVDEILSATQDDIKTSEPVLSSIIEFHSVNKQFDVIQDLVKSCNPSGRIFGIILHHASKDEVQFFHFYTIMTNDLGIKPTASIVKAGIDLALTARSAKTLENILQSAHVSGIPVEESQMARLIALTNSFQVPVRVRRRIREILKLIDPSFIS